MFRSHPIAERGNRYNAAPGKFFIHAAANLLCQIDGVVFIHGFEQRFNQDGSGVIRQLFCDGDDVDAAVLSEHGFIEDAVLPAAGKTGKFPDKDQVKGSGLLSVGTIGLIKAVNTFRADKGSRLATYAAKCVENEILMLLRSSKKYSREVSLFEPIGIDKDGETVSLVDVLEMENKEVLDSIILTQDVKELYEAYEHCLKENEKQVIRMRYGLFGIKEETQREIAKKLGISRSYVSRIEKKAVEKLRRQDGFKVYRRKTEQL